MKVIAAVMNSLRLLFASVALLSVAASAQTYVFDMDPHQSRVTFTLDAAFHTVHGTFLVKSGAMRFDPSTGAASGMITVDATSGNTGNHGRDHKMHKDILETAKYPDITFAPDHVTGQVPQEGKGQVTLAGLMTLHGQPHEMSVNVPVEVHAGQIVADIGFVVPYVQWGVKNPSTFVLRVSDKVEIGVHAAGRVQPAPGVAQR